MNTLAEWQSFFTGFKQYSLKTEAPRISLPNVKDAEQFFSLFNEQYVPFVKSGGAINVWDVAGIGTDEVRNCAVLGWLLDCRGSHGQGPSFLHWFLEAVDMDSLDATCREHFPQAVHVHPPYRTMAECAYAEENPAEETPNSRVDIVIENESFLLFIEAKVRAPKDGKQLTRYADILSSRAGKKPHGLVFLTCDGELADGAPVGKVACISWKRLADAFETHISVQEPLWALLARQFCRHIRTF